MLGDATDEQYVLCDDWVNVLEAAESALNVLKELCFFAKGLWVVLCE